MLEGSVKLRKLDATGREVISRLLKQMEKEGTIAMERGKIKIIKAL